MRPLPHVWTQATNVLADGSIEGTTIHIFPWYLQDEMYPAEQVNMEEANSNPDLKVKVISVDRKGEDVIITKLYYMTNKKV